MVEQAGAKFLRTLDISPADQREEAHVCVCAKNASQLVGEWLTAGKREMDAGRRYPATSIASAIAAISPSSTSVTVDMGRFSTVPRQAQRMVCFCRNA